MRWQYYTISFGMGGFFRATVDRNKMDAKMAQLAGEGWELVSAIPIAGYQGGATREVLMIFKRPLSG